MKKTYSYACKDYPGMEECSGQFVAESEDEIRQLIELHARVAHGEEASAWSDDDRAQIRALIRVEQV